MAELQCLYDSHEHDEHGHGGHGAGHGADNRHGNNNRYILTSSKTSSNIELGDITVSGNDGISGNSNNSSSGITTMGRISTSNSTTDDGIINYLCSVGTIGGMIRPYIGVTASDCLPISHNDYFTFLIYHSNLLFKNVDFILDTSGIIPFLETLFTPRKQASGCVGMISTLNSATKFVSSFLSQG